MLRDQQKRAFSVIYRDFGKQANLAPEKLEAFSNLLADDVMTNINHITALLRDGRSAEEIEQIFSGQEAELHTKVQALLEKRASASTKSLKAARNTGRPAAAPDCPAAPRACRCPKLFPAGN
jgi:hypothetical protein